MTALEWAKKQLEFYRDDWNGHLQDMFEDDVAALETIIGYLEGYDPAECEPDLGQWVVVEDMGATPENPGKQVMQWVNTPECVRWFLEDVKGEPGEGDAQVFFVDLVSEWSYRAKSEVKRWYPMVGGER